MPDRNQGFSPRKHRPFKGSCKRLLPDFSRLFPLHRLHYPRYHFSIRPAYGTSASIATCVAGAALSNTTSRVVLRRGGRKSCTAKQRTNRTASGFEAATSVSPDTVGSDRAFGRQRRGSQRMRSPRSRRTSVRAECHEDLSPALMRLLQAVRHVPPGATDAAQVQAVFAMVAETLEHQPCTYADAEWAASLLMTLRTALTTMEEWQQWGEATTTLLRAMLLDYRPTLGDDAHG